jgi:hypothetical protein
MNSSRTFNTYTSLTKDLESKPAPYLHKLKNRYQTIGSKINCWNDGFGYKDSKLLLASSVESLKLQECRSADKLKEMI